MLVPAQVHPDTGYRFYEPGQVGDAMLVRQLRDVGFGVPAIGALLAARDTSTFTAALEQQRAVLVDETRAAQHRLDLIDRMRETHRKELIMSVTIDEHPFEARRIVALRDTIPSYADEGRLWERLLPEVARQRIAVDGPCGAIDLDEEFQESDVDKEIFVQAPAGTTAAKPLTAQDLPEQNAVRATLTGPSTEIGDACDQLVRWAAERGTPGTGGMRYVYLNDVRSTPPEQLVTEIYLPIGG